MYYSYDVTIKYQGMLRRKDSYQMGVTLQCSKVMTGDQLKGQSQLGSLLGQEQK